jgi:nitrite reductase (NADH) small subunit
MSGFIKVARLDALREGRGHGVTADGRDIALFLIDGKVYAIENLCPHQHIPVLAEGELEGTVITCPMHGWRFDLATGKSVDAASRLTGFETRIEGNDVFVAFPEVEDEPWW